MKSSTLAFATTISLGVLAAPAMAVADETANTPEPINCPISPEVNLGMTFSAKYPDKEGKYYIIPAEVVDAIINAIKAGTILVIDKPPACLPSSD